MEKKRVEIDVKLHQEVLRLAAEYQKERGIATLEEAVVELIRVSVCSHNDK